MKSEIIAINRKFEKKDFPEMKKISIDLLHKGNSIEVNSSLVISNNNKSELTQYLFSLNPSLEVSDVTSAGKALIFKTDGHIIEITPARPLQPGNSDSLTISYSGSVSESFCYPGYSDNFRDFPYRTAMLNINKRQSFLTPGYLLLTPETHWYPVAGLNYYPSNPATIKVDFTKFRLSAVSENRLVAVSQGDMEKNGEKFIYEPATPLTGLTLAMGSYLKDSIKIDSVRYYTWYFKGNDYYKKDLAELKDTLKYLVSGIMRELESTFSVKYPFPTLSVVEVPVQFYSLPRQNTQTRAELQPSMVLVPEKLVTLDNAGFGKSFTRSKKRAARNNQVITDKEIQLRLFNNFIRQTFISGEDFRFENGRAINEPVRFRLGPSFYFFRNNFYSTEYPVLNAAFESHLQKVTIPDASQRFGGFFATVSEADLANLILRNLSFRELMERSPDVDTVRKVLAVKGDYLFSILRKFAGIEEFNKWFPAYLEKNKFKKINVLEFDDDIYTRFGFRLYGYLGDWFNGRQQPGFRFTNLQAKEMVVNERKRYLVTFIASNPESTGGLFTAAFRTGSETGGGQLNMGMINFRGQGTSVQISGQVRGVDAADLSRIVYLNPHESKQISIILDNTPRELIINTMFSLNLPGEIILPVNDITKSRQKPERVLEELTVQSPPEIRDINELIIDNEDSGFVNPKVSGLNPLKKMLGVRNEERELYGVINNFFAPEHWQPVIQTTYYGKYVLSAVYTRAGTGDKSVTWKGLITKAGYYDIYTHIGKSGSSVSITNASGPQGGQQQKGDNTYSDFHFRIFHDDGIEELSLDYQNAEPGWNKLGTYYLSGDTAKVTLTNKSQGRLVVGDAVKWVLQK